MEIRKKRKIAHNLEDYPLYMHLEITAQYLLINADWVLWFQKLKSIIHGHCIPHSHILLTKSLMSETKIEKPIADCCFFLTLSKTLWFWIQKSRINKNETVLCYGTNSLSQMFGLLNWKSEGCLLYHINNFQCRCFLPLWFCDMSLFIPLLQHFITADLAHFHVGLSTWLCLDELWIPWKSERIFLSHYALCLKQS